MAEDEPIEVETPTVGCGGGGPMGHPMVYLTMTEGSETVCPYCSRRFVPAQGARDGETGETGGDH